MFRRRRRDDEEFDDEVDETLGEGADERGVAAAREPVAPGRPAGPWDSDDVPDDGLPRLDLGGLLVPVMPGMEARVDVDQEQQAVVSATLVDGTSALQINAFAAPKKAGIWGEVRDEIVESLRQNGGSAEVVEGPFGPEIRAQVPSAMPDQAVTLQPARFIGVDGPRWFLRGLLSGAGAADPAHGERLEEAFRNIVVVRGGDAMAPRDALPLRLPREAMEAAQQQAEEQQKRQLDPFERGPEITEVR